MQVFRLNLKYNYDFSGDNGRNLYADNDFSKELLKTSDWIIKVKKWLNLIFDIGIDGL
ncbi:MAG: hypothetical protein J5659_04260 [Clostridia bacterium]|nr:hypothetical protein [Clostridia bacterium]